MSSLKRRYPGSKIGITMNYKAILIKNIEVLKALSDDLTSHVKIAKRCQELGHDIGPRTIGHLLDSNDPQSPTLDTITAVAAAFRVKPWMLLAPEFDAHKRTIADLPPQPVIEMARRLLENETALAYLHDIFSAPVPDARLEENGIKAPLTAHQPAPVYHAPRAPKAKLKR